MNKILSIIVPSYNMEAYLPKCLGSLVVEDSSDPNSSFSLLNSLDVIVVNDGSKDRTSEIAHEFERKYPGVFRVIDKENGHYGSCVNAGLAVAQGKYVKVLDADDSFNTENFARYLKFLRTCEADVVLNAYVTIKPNQEVIVENRFPFKQNQLLPISELAQTKGSYYMHALAYRVEMLRSISYAQLEGVLYSDGEWCALPILVARTLRYFPDEVYRYLVGREGQSVCSSVRDGSFPMMVSVLRDIEQKRQAISGSVSAENVELYHQWVKTYAGMMYGILFRDVTWFNFSRLFDLLDGYLRSAFAGVYADVDASTHLHHYRFHYLWFVRRHRWLKLPVLMFVRALAGFREGRKSRSLKV